jgi:hypothetical protein
VSCYLTGMSEPRYLRGMFSNPLISIMRMMYWLSGLHDTLRFFFSSRIRVFICFECRDVHIESYRLFSESTVFNRTWEYAYSSNPLHVSCNPGDTTLEHTDRVLEDYSSWLTQCGRFKTSVCVGSIGIGIVSRPSRCTMTRSLFGLPLHLPCSATVTLPCASSNGTGKQSTHFLFGSAHLKHLK